MTRPLEKGSFVVHEAHPEHGLGRVVAIGTFATRVMFARGGLRVFRADDTQRLKSVQSPPAADVALLEGKESALANGFVDSPAGIVAKAVAAPKKPRAKKAIAPSA